MTANEYGTFSFGSTVYPLTGSTADSSLRDIDPPLYYMLDFCASVMQIHLGARWTAECNRVGRTDLAAGIVQMRVAYDPTPYNLATEFQYPLLALFRKGAKLMEKSRAWDRSEQDIGLFWILPQITAAQAEVLIPFLKAAKEVLFNRNENGFDPAYLNGQSVGQLAGFDAFGFLEASLDNIPVQASNGAPTIYMPTLIMGGLMRERNNPVTGEFEALTGVDVETDLVPDASAEPDTIYPNLVDTSTNL